MRILRRFDRMSGNVAAASTISGSFPVDVAGN
jgi:hypothetical protein